MKTIKRLYPLLVLFAFAVALAVDPPKLKIIELSDQLGIKVLTSEDAVNYALGVTSSDIEDLYAGQHEEYRQRLEGAGLPNPGEPLYIDSPLKLDSDPPDDQRIRKVLADKAKRYLLKQGLNESDPDFARWLELTQKWMWRDVLAKYGPRYLVPLFNEHDECLATMIVYAWAQQGSISTTLTACPRDYPYLSKGDALRRLADEGIEPVNDLRPVFIPARFQRWPVRACNSANTSADTLIGVWTDGLNAIGIASGNVYRLSTPFESLDDLRRQLKYTIKFIEAPDEDPRNIVPDYQGFMRLVACGDPHQSSYTAKAQSEKSNRGAAPKTAAIYLDNNAIEEIPTDRFLGEFASFWGDHLTIDDIQDVVRNPQKLAALAKYSPDSHALDTLEIGPLLRAESLVHLPENPPQTAFAKLLTRTAAKSRQQLFLEYESDLPLDQAEKDVWDQLRIQTGPHFYFTLHDPETGLCIALLSSPALKKGINTGYSLMECPSNTGPLNAEAAAKLLGDLEPGGNHPLRLVLIPTRPEGSSLRCDPLMYKGPYWSDGALAVNAFSHNVYRILPTGVDWINDPPPPYLQTNRMMLDEKPYEYLMAYLPLRLESIVCHLASFSVR